MSKVFACQSSRHVGGLTSYPDTNTLDAKYLAGVFKGNTTNIEISSNLRFTIHDAETADKRENEVVN